jgi:hypothetical protein
MDPLESLFTDTRTDEQRRVDFEASIAAHRAAHAAIIAADAARVARLTADRSTNACPRCGGRGYLPQFQHRKGGECFACGSTGVFNRYRV